MYEHKIVRRDVHIYVHSHNFIQKHFIYEITEFIRHINELMQAYFLRMCIITTKICDIRKNS